MHSPSIRRNTVFSFLSSAVRLGTNLLMFVGIARFYGPEAFGQFTIAHTYLTLFFLVADFGFDMLVVTEVARAREKSRELLERYLSMKLVFSLGATLAMMTVALLSSLSPGTRLLMLILGSGITANAITSLLAALFKGHENLYEEMRVSFIQNLFLLFSLVLLGLLQVPLAYIAGAFVGSRILGVAVLFRRSMKILGGARLRLNFSEWRSAIRKNLPFGVHLIFGTLYFQLDTILLAYMKGDDAVGTYQAAMKIVVLLLLIPDILSNVMIPTLSRLYGEDKDRWEWTAQVLTKTLWYIGLSAAAIVYLYPDEMISLIYGARGFAEAGPVLRILAVTILVRYIAEPAAMMLTTSQHQRSRMYVVMGITVFSLAGNLYAIPRYGISGAAVVSVLTSLIAGIMYICLAQIRCRLKMWIIRSRQIVASALTVLMVFGLSILHFRTLFIGAPSIVLVSLALYYSIGYSHDERPAVFALSKWIRSSNY